MYVKKVGGNCLILALAEAGLPAPELVPITFTVIIGTVTLYALLSSPMARWLGIARPEPTGVAMLGSQSWVLDLAEEVARNDIKTLVIVTEGEMSTDRTLTNAQVYIGELADAGMFDELDRLDVGQAIALSTNREHNDFAIGCFAEALGRANVYLLPYSSDEEQHELGVLAGVWGRRPFASETSHETIQQAIAEGWQFGTVELTSNGQQLPHPGQLMVIIEDGHVVINTAHHPGRWRTGQKLVMLSPV